MAIDLPDHSVKIVDESGNPTGPTSSDLLAGTTSATTVAAAIATSQTIAELIVQNDPDNTVDIFVGNSTSQPLQLLPGQSVTIGVSNINKVYAKSASGTAVVNYLARYNP